MHTHKHRLPSCFTISRAVMEQALILMVLRFIGLNLIYLTERNLFPTTKRSQNHLGWRAEFLRARALTHCYLYSILASYLRLKNSIYRRHMHTRMILSYIYHSMLTKRSQNLMQLRRWRSASKAIRSWMIKDKLILNDNICVKLCSSSLALDSN